MIKKTPKELFLAWVGYAVLVAFYVALTALVLYGTMYVFFPDLTYVDYLLPAFGILFAFAGGTDLANLKTDIEIKRKRQEFHK